MRIVIEPAAKRGIRESRDYCASTALLLVGVFEAQNHLPEAAKADILAMTKAARQ